MSQNLKKIETATTCAERTLRTFQGLCLAASLLGHGGGERLAKLAFHGRIAIYSLDLLKDIYGVTPYAEGEDRRFPDLTEGKCLTLKNTSHLCGLFVNLSTVGILATDVLKMLPNNRVCDILNGVCDPLLVICYVIDLRTGSDKGAATVTALDLATCLAPYLGGSWAHELYTISLIASGTCGLYVALR
ncbi:MAG: hypothetical protein AB7F31_00040 [Parachlamydiales bacterium]